MKKQKIVTIIALLLIASTALANTPIGEKADEIIDSELEMILDFVEAPNEYVEEVEIIPDDSESNKSFDEKIYDVISVEENEIALFDTQPLGQELTRIKAGLDEQGLMADAEKEYLKRFALITNNYNVDYSDRVTVAELIEAGLDTDRLLEIYEFIQITNAPIDAVEEIYLNMENYNATIEEAFAMYNNSSDDELSVEDVEYYVGNGIPVDDIFAAYEISLSSGQRLRDMLDKKLSGLSWQRIIMGENISDEENELSIREILYIFSVANMLDETPENIINVSDGKLCLTENAENTLQEKILYNTAIEEQIGKFENIDKEIAEQVISEVSFADKDAVMELVKQNYSIQEICEAYQDDRVVTLNGVTAIAEEVQK